MNSQNVNEYLRQKLSLLKEDEIAEIVKVLVQRLQIEILKRDKSGIYGFTQRKLAYYSNRIEGSALTERQTTALFETGTVLAAARTTGQKTLRKP